MKNSITTFICAMALSTSLVFANTEDKTTAAVKNSLPASIPALESPAPQRTATTVNTNKYTPAQKAAIVELKLTKASVK